MQTLHSQISCVLNKIWIARRTGLTWREACEPTCAIQCWGGLKLYNSLILATSPELYNNGCIVWGNCQAARWQSWVHYPCVWDQIGTANRAWLLTPWYPIELSIKGWNHLYYKACNIKDKGERWMKRIILLIEQKIEVLNFAQGSKVRKNKQWF
jgi:hypothetical protein